MRRFARWLCRFIAALVLIWLALGLTTYAGEWILRLRAERLLSDIQTMQVQKGTWADFQKFQTRWGKWATYYGKCDSDECQYRVTIIEAPTVWLPKEAPQPFYRMLNFLDLLGLRLEAVEGFVSVHQNHIVEKQFTVQIGPASVRAGWHEGPTLSPHAERAAHPNHQEHLYKPQLFVTAFTPDEEASLKARLMQVDFHCLTALRLCSDAGEFLPGPYQEYLSEGNASEAELEACAVPFWVFARDEMAVLQGEVLHAKRPDDLPENNATWLVTVHVTNMLKGKLRIPLDQPLVFQVDGIAADQTGNFPYKNLVAAGFPNFNGDYEPFVTMQCEVVEATPKNLADAKRGVQSDFDPQLPSARYFVTK
jgi:hypothetical protein